MRNLVRCSEGMYCKHRTRLEKRVDSFDLTKAHDALNAAQAARLLVQAQQHHGRISRATQASSRLGCMYSTIKHEKFVEPSNHPGALHPMLQQPRTICPIFRHCQWANKGGFSRTQDELPNPSMRSALYPAALSP